ncbi:MAG: hypothetical protein M1833_006846 [Piccolia ochrophora]|nr:MAG: hypothetical protein M1833_006846 [Piccolia ochrophora]
MDTSYLTSQVANITGQLHGLFDDIGIPNNERDSREAELFAALSETLHNQLRLVTAEKKDMTEEAQRIITTIKQMETSLDDPQGNPRYNEHDTELKVSFPLAQCLQTLKEKHNTISRIHRERYEQVKKLVQALQSYASHLESSFVQIPLPPVTSHASVPPTFDLSPSYLTSLDSEFSRVYEEYTRRVTFVKTTSDEIIKLWAELGTAQAQTDNMIVKYCRDAPEQLGLQRDDLNRLSERKDKLVEEKRSRERRLKELRSAVEGLWERLGVEQHQQKSFLNANRGCGMRVVNEFEDELAKLNELKRQNLHLFVEDARCQIQDLWDSLYFSEEEMLEFTPAFSDVYSDALLSAHEAEIARLEALREQRAPTLDLIDKHRTLVNDKNALVASSQDASRLMARGQTGQKRDPTRLLREEKMRKRITKELPKVEADLRKVLENWEAEYGRPFCVRGERYLDELAASAARAVPPRSKTPSGPPPRSKTPSTLQPPSKVVKSAPASQRGGGTVRGMRPPSRAGTKTPTGSIRGNPFPASSSTAAGKSPSRIPARVPLGNMPQGNNSPERRGGYLANNSTMRKMGPPSMAPPPRMRDLFVPPAGHTPANFHDSDDQRSASVASSGESVRPMSPEDVYDDRAKGSSTQNWMRHSQQSAPPRPYESQNSLSYGSHYQSAHHDQVPSSRQISATSNSTTANTNASGSENWETYDDASEPERDASEEYYARLRAAQGKRFIPDTGYAPAPAGPGKRVKGIPAYGTRGETTIEHGGRMVAASGSEAGWTDEDIF